MSHPHPFDADQAQRVHLSHFLDHATSACLESFPASFVEPCAYWSHVEKASFFKSLARHSRWKPDLIVADIGGGKTLAEVCSYIELLEEGSAREPQKGPKRDAYPTAHEVSEEWIAVENAAAENLCAEEAEWQRAALKQKRAKELKEMKNLLRRGREIVRENDLKGDEITASQNPERKAQGENEEWEERYKASKQELRGLWKREDMLSFLDRRYLKTMDNMLQTPENTEADDTMEGAQPELEGIGQQSAMSCPSQVPAPDLSRVPDPPRNLGSLPAQSMIVDHLPQTPPPSPPYVTRIPDDLSPASRRRIRKRLWTRRKRAMEAGISVSEVSMDMVKLKRGRKPKTKALGERVKEKESLSETQAEVDLLGASRGLLHPPPSQEPPRSMIQGDSADAAGDKVDVPDESKSGSKRKPYGWGKLTARQVSGAMLRTDGMDLFHLERFASIMSLLRHGHTFSNEADHFDEGDSSEGSSTLSYPLLRLLRACLIRFVTHLVAYVVLHKDVETRQKRRIRRIFQTGGAEKIRAENVREALLRMNKDASTKQFFMRLKSTIRKAVAAQAPSARDGSDPRDEDGSDETGSSDDGSRKGEIEDDMLSPRSPLSVRFSLLSQQAFPPPCNDSQAVSPLFWNPSVLSIFVGKERDTLLPDEVDGTGLQKELRAEDKIEETDRETARMHERELWMEIGVKPVEGDNTAMKVGPSQSLRFKKPGGTVKSKVYIDSD